MKNSKKRKKYKKRVSELNKNDYKRRKTFDSCSRYEVVDEIFPDVDHDIEGVTFEGKPLFAWSIDGMLDSFNDD